MSAQREDQLQQFIQLCFALQGIEQSELQTGIAPADGLADDNALVMEQFSADTFVHGVPVFGASRNREQTEHHRTDFRLHDDFHIGAFSQSGVEVSGIVNALCDQFRPAFSSPSTPP